MCEDKNESRRDAASGFALVLAILALMLLTFLALTLSFTTSTELQISTNYRWSQQAYYNAEAGLEAAKAVLSTMGGDASPVLPDPRAVTWMETSPHNIPVAPFPAATRNFENNVCDNRGNGAGYGAIFANPNNPGALFENMTTIFGQTLNGGFTVWIRRPVIIDDNGNYQDDPNNQLAVITSEGSAPYRGNQLGTAGTFTRANRALRFIETTLDIREACPPGKDQESATGSRGCQ